MALHSVRPSVALRVPRVSFDYKSVTGPMRLTVLVPLLVVITFGDTVAAIRGLPPKSSVLLANLMAVDPVVMVTTLLLSDDLFCCNAFKRYSKLKNNKMFINSLHFQFHKKNILLLYLFVGLFIRCPRILQLSS